jgi:hypothetical protein
MRNAFYVAVSMALVLGLGMIILYLMEYFIGLGPLEGAGLW